MIVSNDKKNIVVITIEVDRDRLLQLWKQLYVKNFIGNFYPKGDNQDYVSELILNEYGVTVEMRPPIDKLTLKEKDKKELRDV